MQREYLIAGFLGFVTLGLRPSAAQYTANLQTNTISGVVSNWVGDYAVGSNTIGDVLVLENGGVLTSGYGYIGFDGGSSNNSVVVTDAGSQWQNTNRFYVGFNGSGNSLIISNGASVTDTYGYVGFNSGSNNTAVVTGVGSLWDSSIYFSIGYQGGSNKLVIRDGGWVSSPQGAVIGLGGDGKDSVVVSGNGSAWDIGAGYLYVGQGGTGNSLVISNSGQIVNNYGFVGFFASSGNNALVTGSGSVWTNSGQLNVGSGINSNNSFWVSAGGYVVSTAGFINGATLNNQVVVTGSNSMWRVDGLLEPNGGSLIVSNGGRVASHSANIMNGGQIVVTGTGSSWSTDSNVIMFSRNSLVVSNGGLVVGSDTRIGVDVVNNGSNLITVVDGGIWQNGSLRIGDQGSLNTLQVRGGSVSATNLTIGFAPVACNNLVQLDSGSVLVTNPAANAVLEVRNGILVLNGGTLVADRLVMTNTCAQFKHSGGTASIGSVVLDSNLFRITSITRQGNDLLITWLMGPGITNSLQVATAAANGSYTTNGFGDIFVVTNNAIAGTLTNYLDIGAATNAPTRYYRARLAL